MFILFFLFYSRNVNGGEGGGGYKIKEIKEETEYLLVEGKITIRDIEINFQINY